jgi:hypothetical protein
LGRLPSLKIDLQVSDQRPIPERERVGIGCVRETILGGGARTVHYTLISTYHPEAILSDAVRDTLKINGHIIVPAGGLTGDVLIQVQLKKFMSYPVEHLDVGAILESAFEMDIAVLTKPDNIQILTTPIRTIYRRQGFMCYKLSHCYRDVLDEGLKRFIQSFSTDPEVIEVFRSISHKR